MNIVLYLIILLYSSDFAHGSCDEPWTLVFKGVKGLNGDLYDLWTGSVTLNADNDEAKRLDDSFSGHYKSELVEEWNQLNVTEVKVALYTAGEEKTYFIFNGESSDKLNWFSKERLIDSPYQDLGLTTETNYFSIEGHAPIGRRFFIHAFYRGCEKDAGWLTIATGQSRSTCEWDFSEECRFLYSPLTTKVVWDSGNPGEADVFAIFLRARRIEIDPCETYTAIDDRYRSAAFNSHNIDSNIYICDNDLEPGWYRFTSEAGGLMPTSCTSQYHCGTHYPAWLNDELPSIGECKAMAVCINEGDDDCCDSSTNITVKDCGDFYVYKLEPLPMCPSAYCAGDREPCPPGFGSSDGFQPGCSENYPRLEENPIVMPKYNGDAMYGYLECLFAGPITQNVRYTVEWLMDDNAVKTTDVTADSQQDILREDEYVMGCTIKCQVVTHFHDSNILSPAYISNDIFIGIIASPNFITTREDMTGPGHDVSIWATVPMSCKIELQAERFFLARPEIVFSTCTVDIRHDSYNTLQKVKVDAVRDFQIDGDQLLTVYVKPSDICSVNVKEGYRESITVEVTDVITGRCTSRGDPHYITYDGRGFDSYIIGDFVLQRSQNRDFEVHARTWRCWEVACNCGVVVRENNDVIGVNMCDGEWGKTAPRVIKYSEGNFTAGVSITIDDGGKLFTIAMPSGSRIIAHTYEWGMDIDLTVPSDDFGSTVGLCGVLDDDITNDYTLSDGMISEYTGRDPIDFVSSWMMQPGESLFQSLPDKVGVDRSQRGQSEEQVGCDCSMHVAFDQNQDRHCEHTTGGRARRPVGRQLSSLDVTEEINDMASRLGSSMTTTIDADHGHTEARRTIRRDVQHETDWPTVSGITFQQAEECCRATVLESPIANYCTDIPGVDPFRGVPGCIEDIGLIDGFDLVYVAVEEMIDHCEDVALKNISLYSNASGSYKPAAFLGDMICPQQCSNHGNCLRGICQCDDEYGGADCSVDLTRPPDVWYIEGSEDHGLCDIRSGLCQSISVIGDNLLNSQTLTCRYEFVKKSGDIWTAIDHNKVDADAVFISFREVYCLPDEIILAVENSNENSGVTSATLRVFISNDAGNTSSNGMLLTIYDSKCLRCESRGLCILKETACEINGQCFAHGDLHPADAELQCLSDIDQYNWSMRGEVQSSTVWIIGVAVAVVIIAAVGVGGLCILVYKKSGKKKVDAM